MITRERSYSTDAIVLERRSYGEADRILVVYTPTYGRLDVIAKGASKTKSKSGPYLDTCSWVRLELATGRDLDVVRSASPVRVFSTFGHHLDRYCHANYLVELVRTLTHVEEPNTVVFELLSRSLILIDEGVDPWVITRHFELALLNELGYRPQLFECVGCGEQISAQTNAFSSVLGGLLCPNCRELDPLALPMSVNAQKYLRLMQKEGLASIARLAPNMAEKIEVQQALENYISFISDREIRSLKALQQLAEQG